jgi:hypothetical protein
MKTYTVTLTTAFTSLAQLLTTAGYPASAITPSEFSGTTKANIWTITSDWQLQGASDTSTLPILMTQVMPFERVHDLLNLKLKATTASTLLYIMLM